MTTPPDLETVTLLVQDHTDILGSNDSGDVGVVYCPDDIPAAADVFKGEPLSLDILVGLVTIITAIIIAIYIEEFIFVTRHFRMVNRGMHTLTLLAVFPVLAFTSHLAVLVPRSSTLMDLVATSYIGFSLFTFVGLITEYFGDKKMYHVVKDKAVQLRGPPLCCCCFCLPTLKFNCKVYHFLKGAVMQGAILRPLLMLIAAVLWTNGTYTPGDMSGGSSYLYIHILNIVFTMIAVYGLHQLTNASLPALASYNLKAKHCILQVVQVSTAILGLLTSLVFNLANIPCTPPLNDQGRQTRVYNIMLIIEMLPLSLLARKLYRRSEEGGKNLKSNTTPTVSVDSPLTDSEPITTPPTSSDKPLFKDNADNDVSPDLPADGTTDKLSPQQPSINQQPELVTNENIAELEGHNLITAPVVA